MTDLGSVPGTRAGVYHRSLGETGGDFCEVLSLGTGVLGYFVADVSGHESGVGLIHAALREVLRRGAGAGHTPMTMLRALNTVLHQVLGEEQFVTACFAVLDRARLVLTVANAAGPPLVKVRADGGTVFVGPVSDVLGPFEPPALGLVEMEVSQGDRLYLCTDGCLDSLAHDSGASWERFVRESVAQRRQPVENAPTAIMARLFPDPGDIKDDQLLLVVEV